MYRKMHVANKFSSKGQLYSYKTCRLHYVFQSSITFESVSILTEVRKRQNDGRNWAKNRALILHQMILVNTSQSSCLYEGF